MVASDDTESVYAFERARRRIKETRLAGHTILNLTHFGITRIPEELWDFTDLTELYLERNRLTSIPVEIGRLRNLQSLRLQMNALTRLPDQIGALGALRWLAAFENRLSDIPESIGQLGQLRELDVSSNRVERLPESLGRLGRLEQLNVANNRLSDMPAVIGNLPRLRQLQADRNQLESIPSSIGHLRDLEYLRLERNKIAVLPAELGMLPKLQVLNVSGNQLPRSISALADRPEPEAILSYLRSILGKSMPLYEAKLLLVGEGEVGKSTLLAALRGDTFVIDRESTHGLEIRDLELPHPVLADTEIHLNAWDFGGQRVYRPTHQFFFTPRSLYLVVWDPRKGADQCDVEGWIRLIRLRVGSTARILVVSTHADDGRIARIRRDYLSAMYPEIVSFHEVDSLTGTGLRELTAGIASAAADLPQMGTLINSKWDAARRTITSLPAPQMSKSEFFERCVGADLTVPESSSLLELMTVLGYVAHYDDEGLRDFVILQPEWLSKAIGFVLEDEVTYRASGELEHERLRDLWFSHGIATREQYPLEFHPFFLRLMEKFDVSYRLDGGQSSLVGQLVPESPVEAPAEFSSPVPDDLMQVDLTIAMEEQPPDGLIPWLIVRTHRWATEPRRQWQTGMVLSYRNHGSALMELRGPRLRIRVRAEDPAYFATLLVDHAQLTLRERWPGLNFGVYAPCSSVMSGEPCDGVLRIDALQRARREGRSDFPCQTCGQWHRIDRILFGYEANPEGVREQLKAIEEMAIQIRDEGRANASAVAQATRSLLRVLASESFDGPRLFSLLLPPGTTLQRLFRRDSELILTLWCEEPENEHPVCGFGTGGGDLLGDYRIRGAPQALRAIAPYARIALDVLAVVVPSGVASTMLRSGANSLARSVTEMSRIVTELEQSRSGDYLSARELGEERQLRFTAEGAGIRAFQGLLRDLDPNRRWGGLRAVTTMGGDVLWVCPTHYRLHDPGLPELPYR